MSDSDSINVLGIRVHACDQEQAVGQVEAWLRAPFSRARYVCVTGVHGVMESRRDRAIARIHNRADMVVPDGMPLVCVGRVLGHRHMGRVYGPDLMLAVLDRCARSGHRSYFYGGAEGVADELARRMAARFPGLAVAGTHTPPFRPLTEREDAEAVERIGASGADVVWIGLSTPKQERLMGAWQDRVRAKVMIGVGAAFDFHTGRVRQAPRWMMRSGLEWLFRFYSEPRRLGPRYLRNNPAFLFHIALQLSGLRCYPLTGE